MQQIVYTPVLIKTIQNYINQLNNKYIYIYTTKKTKQNKMPTFFLNVHERKSKAVKKRHGAVRHEATVGVRTQEFNMRFNSLIPAVDTIKHYSSMISHARYALRGVGVVYWLFKLLISVMWRRRAAPNSSNTMRL